MCSEGLGGPILNFPILYWACKESLEYFKPMEPLHMPKSIPSIHRVQFLEVSEFPRG